MLHRSKSRLTLVVLAVVAAVRLAAWVLTPPEPIASASEAGPPGTLQGVVVSLEPDTVDGGGSAASMRLSHALFEGESIEGPLSVHFEIVDALPEVGSAVRLQAQILHTRPYVNPSPFPPAPGPPRIIGLSAPEPDPDRGVPWTAAVAAGLRANLTFEDATVTALMRALVLGDRTELPPELRWAYQDTGLAHLLAISGFNLAVLGWGLFKVLRWLALKVRRLAQTGRPTAWAAGVALVFVATYTLVIMPSDATDRAMLGMGIALGAVVLGRRAYGWRTLLVCFLVAIALEPASLMRPGFQLTFAASAALLGVAPSVRAWRAWLAVPGRVSRPWLRVVLTVVGAVVLADLATFFATAPLGLCWFGQLTPHGLWLNLVAIPAMSFVVFPLALVAAITGLDVGASLAGRLFDDLVMTASQAVGSTSTAMWPVALGMLACVGVLLALRAGVARRVGAGVVATASIVAAVIGVHAPELTMVALDVGHGDALALRLPDGTRVLVDTGGARFGDQGSRVLAERVVVPALRSIGFDRIDLLVLTHADLDHAGAAAWIAARIPIGEVWIPPCARDAPPIVALRERVEARGGSVRAIARQAPFALGGATIEVMAPRADVVRPDESCRVSANDGSLVLRVAASGRSLLLTGDIEARSEAELVRHYGPHLHADVLKAPHHGSRTSSTDAFLDAVAPTLVIISGEPDKPPWPPHPVVLARYRERGYDVHITGSEGAVAVTVPPSGEVVITEAFKPP